MREPKLTSDQVQILATRVYIARTLGVFSLRDLTPNWSISIATLHRYKSPQYRQASRDYAAKTYLSYRSSLQHGVCYRCEDDLTTHARCADCTILMHDGAALCQSCVDTRTRRELRYVRANLMVLYESLAQ